MRVAMLLAYLIEKKQVHQIYFQSCGFYRRPLPNSSIDSWFEYNNNLLSICSKLKCTYSK